MTFGHQLKLTALLAAVVVVVISNRDRGVPFVLLLMIASLLVLTFVAKRTTFGRHVYAVGGNAEAARRAGISLTRIRLIVFAMCSTIAALGGIMVATFGYVAGLGLVLAQKWKDRVPPIRLLLASMFALRRRVLSGLPEDRWRPMGLFHWSNRAPSNRQASRHGGLR